ncbi:MAG: tetratricopeptide repeat protein, partial [Bacteroidales bacterium]|nr:tetratricopeptide repeat protein [Bacteroidales bacterium]
MKQFILLILIMFSVNAFNANYLDSLFAIIKSPSHSDSIKLVTYERITKQLIKTSLDSCRLICNEGLKFSDSIKNYRFKWSFYNRIGRTYHYEARYPEAINYFIKSLNVAETAQDTFTIAQTMNNLGIIYEESGDLEKALQYYNKSVEFKLKLKKQDLYSIAMTKMYAGMVYLKSDEYDKAEKIFKDVLETTEKIEDKTKKFRIYSNIGTYHAYLGSRNNNDRLIFEALKYFFLAETEIDASENSAEKFKILYQIAEAYFVLNDTENGFNNIEKARFIAKELNDLKNFEYIYLVLHNFYFNQENYKMAYYYKDSVEQIRDSIDYSERLTAIAEIETKYQTEKNKKENLELRQKN